ncbi:mechanosensitive ion channel family protein [Synechococcus sp. CBW1108]|uniref:mechanosensitive ion channel family protein n=1 Tax=Synechococcus sp. CBW1108 TaxID=1353147 RepID=UPI0018CFE9AB|nr:mechanosensitive ion channel family protein [Synechococcus sp. CBW1108]QPN70582.1 mechanosensitive ion channel family protein [Synechococcus sp. CBW1108]
MAASTVDDLERLWHRKIRGLQRLLLITLLSLLLLSGTALAVDSGNAPPEAAAPVGSFDVAPVHILGIPVMSVAAPVVSRDAGIPDAQQRATVIEGNLTLLYQPHALCSSGEQISEALLEGLILGGPADQRLCSGDPWSVLGRPDDLTVVVATDDDGQVQLRAQIKGRATPLKLLTVTEADAQLHGMSRGALAQRWRQVLQRRLRHARFTEQAGQISLRLKITLIGELVLAGTSAATLWLWARLRRRLQRRIDPAEQGSGIVSPRDRWLQWLLRLLFIAVLAQLVVMAGLAVAAVPGQIPLAITVLMQPTAILFKVALLGLLAAALRWLARFVLRQWVSTLAVPLEERARRQQRYLNLRQASHRLIDLGCIALLVVLVLADVPGIRELTLGAWLAGGALLGGLAIAFQGLLRDGVAGLVALLDDHYAVGDVVEVNGVVGEVVDVGLLVTELRTSDQRAVQFANSSPQQLINHTKIRSGAEVLIPLSPQHHQLEQALAVLTERCGSFGEDPLWKGKLLAPPWVRGVKQVTPQAIELSVVLTTRAGQQWEVQRALLRRLVVAFQEQGIALANGTTTPNL